MSGPQDTLTKKLWKLHEDALDKAVSVTLRFKVGDKVKANTGINTGKTGIIKNITLRCITPYCIKDANQGPDFWAKDSELE